jgi:hypothetical protein
MLTLIGAGASFLRKFAGNGGLETTERVPQGYGLPKPDASLGIERLH